MVLQVPTIKEDRNYWFVRTKGGKLYDDFFDGKFISIGWDKINEINDNEELAIQKIKEAYPKESHPKLAFTQIKRFLKEMKIGDVVLIPSKGSKEVTFGIVKSDVEIMSKTVEKEGVLNKRRSVEWIRTVQRSRNQLNNDKPSDRLESDLYPLLNSHHTISDANPYEEVIDRTLHSFYIKGDKAYFILEVTKKTGIHANEFFPMGNSILEVLNDFNEVTKSNLNLNELEVKVNVQSPGKIALTGGIILIGVLGLILVGFGGGGVKIDSLGVDIHTDVNVLKSVTYFMDHWEERKEKSAILNKYMDKLEVKTPEELNTLMKSVEINDQKEDNLNENNKDQNFQNKLEQKEKQTKEPAEKGPEPKK